MQCILMQYLKSALLFSTHQSGDIPIAMKAQKNRMFVHIYACLYRMIYLQGIMRNKVCDMLSRHAGLGQPTVNGQNGKPTQLEMASNHAK